ncbi:endonuclease/exonuclease/phosphatase family protein [Algoriphagus halophilus]|uniref:endonuclease/exonuclease/phosphatase family protein n=1 Tax=Algoriphagus halophilus TaxID=226505 RepID=UPI00358F0009
MNENFFFLLSFCLLSGGLVAQDKNELVKILTYNIYHGENPFNPGQPNLDEIAALIKELNPDMVAMQEVDSMTTRTAKVYGTKVDLVQQLAELTGYHGYFAKAMDFAEGAMEKAC